MSATLKNTRIKAVLNTEDAAEYLEIISKRTLEKWRREFRNTKKLRGPKFIDLEGKIGYRLRDLDEYLERCTAQSEDDDAA